MGNLFPWRFCYLKGLLSRAPAKASLYSPAWGGVVGPGGACGDWWGLVGPGGASGAWWESEGMALCCG